jgi:hypothetical protein
LQEGKALPFCNSSEGDFIAIDRRSPDR